MAIIFSQRETERSMSVLGESTSKPNHVDERSEKTPLLENTARPASSADDEYDELPLKSVELFSDLVVSAAVQSLSSQVSD